MTAEDPQRMRIAGQVAAQVAGARDAASYRCSCGFTDDDASGFDRHLNAADDAGPEHFEVLDGWTLEQVRQWQAAANPPDTRMTVRAARA
jgi:hypothetical protein